MHFAMWRKALNVIPDVSKSEWDALDVISKWLISTRAAVLVRRGEGGLRERLAADPEVRSVLSEAGHAGCFDPARSLRHVDAIYARVFGRV